MVEDSRIIDGLQFISLGQIEKIIAIITICPFIDFKGWILFYDSF